MGQYSYWLPIYLAPQNIVFYNISMVLCHSDPPDCPSDLIANYEDYTYTASKV